MQNSYTFEESDLSIVKTVGISPNREIIAKSVDGNYELWAERQFGVASSHIKYDNTSWEFVRSANLIENLI